MQKVLSPFRRLVIVFVASPGVKVILSLASCSLDQVDFQDGQTRSVAIGHLENPREIDITELPSTRRSAFNRR
ncbi:MAG: hypothetical protein HYX43_07885 [Burkholderiales bacterium]|nr:hypothetical protein [Burkholderiales bacterium]